MRKSKVILVTTIIAAVSIVVVLSFAAVTVVYAQNLTITIQQANSTNTINAIKGLNRTTIINAINAEVRSAYSSEASSRISNIHQCRELC